MDRVTLWDAFGAVKRGWVLFVFGLALTAAAVVAIGGTPGVYQSETRVVLSLPPAYQRQSPANQIGPTSGRLIPFAVVIETRINNGHSVRKATSPDVALADEQRYDDWSVHVPDYGGQWASNVTEPVLILQATGPTASVVEVRMNSLIAQVDEQLSELQKAVPPVARVHYVATPTHVVTTYLQGRLSVARAVIAAIGLSISLALTCLLDRVRTRRRARPSNADATEVHDPA